MNAFYPYAFKVTPMPPVRWSVRILTFLHPLVVVISDRGISSVMWRCGNPYEFERMEADGLYVMQRRINLLAQYHSRVQLRRLQSYLRGLLPPEPPFTSLLFLVSEWITQDCRSSSRLVGACMYNYGHFAARTLTNSAIESLVSKVRITIHAQDLAAQAGSF